ncbi:unnamed protein product [Mytilus coruscus]|uniref:MADF domain-containing protein n=1 Tax=Mytilus coruscus TaxID=42192 RepID=A0A6J8C670_MYTCO|nr:unnamed protein product [Mytilus coruscus]
MPRKGRKVNPPVVSIEYDITTSPTATLKGLRRQRQLVRNQHLLHLLRPKSVCRTLTHEEEEDLVAQLRENTFLYDKSSADFKLKEKKNMTWAAKEEELGLKAGDLSSIWYPYIEDTILKAGEVIQQFALKRKELTPEDTDDIDAAFDLSVVSSTATAPGNNPKAARALSSLTSELRVRVWCHHRCTGFTCTDWTVLGVLDAPNGPAKDEPIRHTFHKASSRPCG